MFEFVKEMEANTFAFQRAGKIDETLYVYKVESSDDLLFVVSPLPEESFVNEYLPIKKALFKIISTSRIRMRPMTMDEINNFHPSE
jgi:hypothetical protein